MAIAQPLTAFSDAIDDATLKGIDVEAPRIREIHQLLDRCAKESGPQRFEGARRAAPQIETGSFYLMGSVPSPALAALFEAAKDSQIRFSNQLALSSDMMPPEGDIRVHKAAAMPCDPKAPMETFLRMLERDETTSPSSLEGLFEDLQKAHKDGLISMDAGGLSLTDAGRTMIRQARPALDPLADAAMSRVEMQAQEVADGRLSLREAIEALGRDIGINLPLPGQPDEIRTVTSLPDAQARLDTRLFDPLLVTLSQVATRDRAAVATMALHNCLEDWGLSSLEAQSVLQHDIRCLRALGASLSHGPMDVNMAEEVIAKAGLDPVVAVAADAVSDDLLESLAGPRRHRSEPEPHLIPEPEPGPEVELEDDPGPVDVHKASLLRRFLSFLMGK